MRNCRNSECVLSQRNIRLGNTAPDLKRDRIKQIELERFVQANNGLLPAPTMELRQTGLEPIEA